VPIPTNWALTTADGVTTLTSPEESIRVYLLALDEADPEVAIAEAWQQVDPAFDLDIDDITTPPAPSGVERLVSISYNDPTDAQRVVLGQSQLYEGLNYILLLDAQLVGLQQRSAQVQIIGSGFTILALDEVDLADVEPLAVDEALLAQLEAYIDETMTRYQIPGAAVAVVQDSEVIYAEGFGVRNPATGAPVTPQTLMRIGSTGKSLTTLLMATLVDDGLMEWDTPASEILPTFAVADPELSQEITMRNLVCACTGVPRRDYELIFNAHELSAADTVASLRTFDFFTDFGEAFQYSNQMVATGGYLAGLAAGGPAADLMSAYVEALQERVLEPIGMVDTTLSFEVVEASDNYAIPHAADFDLSYEPMPLVIEELLDPVAPAGAHWSTLDDMARYLITQLNQGVAPDGNTVVSAQNLGVTREPQVPVSADTRYGLGWFVGEYRGQPLIHHGGNTFGFTSDFAFLPDADVGIIVLTNAQGSNFFNEGVRTRLFELIFEQEMESDAQIQFAYEQLRQVNEEVLDRLVAAVDGAAVEPFVGRYRNEALGEVTLTLENGELWLDVGEFRTGLLPLLDDAEEAVEGYLFLDPPLKGLLIKLEGAEDDQPILVLGEGVIQYMFEPVE
jgi:CubicO group peptidase (beta-lactamase class C family)